nr:immunoglobulin light chain junction region [Macaca mulatta]MOW03325.1 immunoglobulin light chain junction region [Macaca mulatta]MOW03872.1 immunoglobulin light chain junction region [Macaca mulatta]MOW03936.1 immunoglobulin light chain junction region [Macaca mulatta]
DYYCYSRDSSANHGLF